MTKRWAGIGLFSLGVGILSLLPLFMAVFPRYGLSREASPETVLGVVAQHSWLFRGPGVVQIAGHALGAVGMIALLLGDERRSLRMTVATFFGLTWMAADLIDNALTMTLVPGLAKAYAAGDGTAPGTLHLVMQVVDAIRLGAHFAGGLWAIGVSLELYRSGARVLGGAGVVIGAVLSANLFAPPLMFASMLTLPFWLMVLGVRLTRTAESTRPLDIGGRIVASP